LLIVGAIVSAACGGSSKLVSVQVMLTGDAHGCRIANATINSNGQQSDENDVALPWTSNALHVPVGANVAVTAVVPPSAFGSLYAACGAVTCRLTVNSKLKATSSAYGQGASAVCRTKV
jgi:hypothetical protein